MYVCMLGSLLCGGVSHALRVVEALHVASIPGHTVGRCAAVAAELADERRREGSLRWPTHQKPCTALGTNQETRAHAFMSSSPDGGPVAGLGGLGRSKLCMYDEQIEKWVSRAVGVHGMLLCLTN